jgi:hypothetical protein
MFSSFDAVWVIGSFGTSPHAYRTQSSGKTLDALVAGVPVVGIAGTFTAQEPVRWTGVPLGHVDPEEAAAVFIHLLERGPSVSASLEGQREAIRAAYSPEATLRRVIQLAGSSGDGREEPTFDRPADLASDAARFSGPRATITRRESIRARLVGRHAARIPLHERVIFRLRERARSARERFVSRAQRGPHRP